MMGVSFVRTYARPTRIVCLFLEKPYRVEWLDYFGWKYCLALHDLV
jgi:hypothetical protein